MLSEVVEDIIGDKPKSIKSHDDFNIFEKLEKAGKVKEIMKQNHTNKKAEEQKNIDDTIREVVTHECLICRMNIADSVIMQCGHGGICFQCGEAIS